MSQPNMEPVVTRFAPSPTGFLHIGGVRTALYAYLWARKHNGTFILRIEDTDKEREVPGSIEHIQESLRWLGLDWDYGPDKAAPFGSTIQSQRLDTYRVAAQTLIDKGLAYPDPYTEEEVHEFRKQAEAEKRPFLYREHRPETFGTWDGTQPLRFKVPEVKRMVWIDEVRGQLEAGEEALDDFILIKSDGYPTYNFAHIVDDYHMGITHIMRADEFISSTPRFLSLYEALEMQHPKFVTLPPILRDDKTKKLGKRDGAKDILEYRTEGYLSTAMVNFLALIGWNPGTEQEVFTKDELIQTFDISRIQTHGAVFNEEKLIWMNRAHLLKMSDEEFLTYIQDSLIQGLNERSIAASDEIIARLVPLIRERISTRTDLETMIAEGELDYYVKDPEITSSGLLYKDETKETATVHLQHALDTFVTLPDETFTNSERIKSSLWEYATEKGRGYVLWPLRYALTGRERSPDPFFVASIVGKDTLLRRITTALEALK